MTAPMPMLVGRKSGSNAHGREEKLLGSLMAHESHVYFSTSMEEEMGGDG